VLMITNTQRWHAAAAAHTFQHAAIGRFLPKLYIASKQGAGTHLLQLVQCFVCSSQLLLPGRHLLLELSHLQHGTSVSTAASAAAHLCLHHAVERSLLNWCLRHVSLL
jgi:hypothetical protein